MRLELLEHIGNSIGEESNLGVCLHHPGVPIFHEGLKFWSCCQRKTTDFNSFLSQEGCREGKHVWKKEGVSIPLNTVLYQYFMFLHLLGH